jgi:hypothetical protein
MTRSVIISDGSMAQTIIGEDRQTEKPQASRSGQEGDLNFFNYSAYCVLVQFR